MEFSRPSPAKELLSERSLLSGSIFLPKLLLKTRLRKAGNHRSHAGIPVLPDQRLLNGEFLSHR